MARRLPHAAALTGKALEDYMRSGPLLAKAGLAGDRLDLARVERLAATAFDALGGPAEGGGGPPGKAEVEGAQERVYKLYVPLYLWIRDQVVGQQKQGGKADEAKEGAATTTTPPTIVGLSCPQGGGKTTMSHVIKALAEQDLGLGCEVVSVDDFYLPFAAQQALAAQHPSNPILAVRGNPGTHDLKLATDTLAGLAGLGPGQSMAVPRYDKAAHGGRGDRADKTAWGTARGPLGLVLLEGWCLGFEQVASAADLSSPHLAPVNEFLADYEAKLYGMLDAFITVRVDDVAWVFQWREQAEAALRAQGRGAMSEEEVKAFVDCYMPAYETYLPGLYAEPTGPKSLRATKPAAPLFDYAIDEMRRPVG